MPRSDLVVDSKLDTKFRDSATIHSFLEIDDVGRRSTREEEWKIEQSLGRGAFGQVRLERCVTPGVKCGFLRAVKIINTESNLYKSLDFTRELEAIAKFSQDRVSRCFSGSPKLSDLYCSINDGLSNRSDGTKPRVQYSLPWNSAGTAISINISIATDVCRLRKPSN
jgi:hypothetical protein